MSTSDSRSPAIVWFQTNLRLADNEALVAAAAARRPVVACYVLDDSARPFGGAARWWLHHSLCSLAAALESSGVELVLRRGKSSIVLAQLVADTGAVQVHAAASAEPDGAALQRQVAAAVEAAGASLHCHSGALLFEPQLIATRAGTPFRVFTPFWKACRSRPALPEPLPVPASLVAFIGSVRSETLDDWALTPRRPNWAGGLAASWEPGEPGAHRQLETFLDAGIAAYGERRDRPDLDAGSRLSPHLHFGELGPRQAWHVVRSAVASRSRLQAGGDAFLRQLGWREFSHHLLYHWPDLSHKAFRPEFEAFPWQEQPSLLDAWQRGQTGYPIVDAGMRQLWQSGWMHNRVRMVAASFLVKHLLIPWQRGAAWFWDTLVDADLANNSAGWQWVAGSGADAAPYFRIFNPSLQGQKFDPQGDYIRRWVPELAAVPAAHIHTPWRAADTIADDCGLVLGRDYPLPIIDHSHARVRALEAYRQLKR